MIRSIVIYAISLYLVSLVLSGLKIEKQTANYLIGGVLLVIGQSILKPILGIVSLPLNLLSFGLFSSFINVIILWGITFIFPKIKISAFQFQGATLLGIHIPSFYASLFLSYVIISATIYIVSALIRWFFTK